MVAHNPTDETRQHVKQMAISGATQEQMADVMGITAKTLAKHYRHELDTALIKANANVAGWLYQQCQGGNVSAQIFWLKTRAKWKETQRNEWTDGDGNSLAFNIVLTDGRSDT